jgi:hypothetical protein
MSPDDRIRIELLITALEDMEVLRQCIEDEPVKSPSTCLLLDLTAALNKAEYYLIAESERKDPSELVKIERIDPETGVCLVGVIPNKDSERIQIKKSKASKVLELWRLQHLFSRRKCSQSFSFQ